MDHRAVLKHVAFSVPVFIHGLILMLMSAVGVHWSATVTIGWILIRMEWLFLKGVRRDDDNNSR